MSAAQQTGVGPVNAPDPQKWITPEARLSYPNLFAPRAVNPGDKEKFSCTLIFPKSVDLGGAKSACYAAAEKFFGANWRDKVKSGELKLRFPFRSGGESDYKDKAGYGPETVFLRCSAEQRPGVVDQSLQPILDSTRIYPGCYVRGSLRAFGYEQKGNKGVAFGLNNIQLLRDGESLGGMSRAVDDFTTVPGAAASQAHDDIDDMIGGGGHSLTDADIPF